MDREFYYEILRLIDMQQEGEYWDFKKTWYEKSKDNRMLIDIICMANNFVNRNAYIIIGVDESDEYSICDISHDDNRKNTQNLTDFLRSKKFAGDLRPVVTVETLEIRNKKIDIIVIHNSLNTPYFLKERYQDVLPHNIYVRLQDSNTPIDRSADINHVEYLWKKRFGLLSTPQDRVFKYLEERNNWIASPVYDDIKYYKYAPEFTVSCERDEDSGAYKYYMFLQVDCTPYWYNIDIRYHQTVIDSVMGISLDGGRYFTTAPQEDGIGIERKFGWDVSFAYYVKDSLRYVLHEFFYDRTESNRYQYEDFVNSIIIFENEDERAKFKEYAKQHWQEYKNIEGIEELHVSELQGYDVEVFKDDYKNVQILQRILIDFRLEESK